MYQQMNTMLNLIISLIQSYNADTMANRFSSAPTTIFEAVCTMWFCLKMFFWWTLLWEYLLNMRRMVFLVTLRGTLDPGVAIFSCSFIVLSQWASKKCFATNMSDEEVKGHNGQAAWRFFSLLATTAGGPNLFVFFARGFLVHGTCLRLLFWEKITWHLRKNVPSPHSH